MELKVQVDGDVLKYCVKKGYPVVMVGDLIHIKCAKYCSFVAETYIITYSIICIGIKLIATEYKSTCRL